MTDPEIIYLYSDIWAGDAGFFVARLLQAKGDVTIAMNSPGGDVFEAAAMYAAVKRYDKGKVTCRIDGIAASAASYLAMACAEVVMAESAFMMIHKPWSVVVGNQDDCERMARDLAQVEAAMVAAYVAKSGKSEREVRKMLEEETLMNAQETVAQGFADRIESAEEPAPAEAPEQMTAKIKATDRRVMAHYLSGADQIALARQNIAASRAQAVAVPVILDIQVAQNGQISALKPPISAENEPQTAQNEPENAPIQADSEPIPADPPPDEAEDQPRSAGIEEEPAAEPAFSLVQPPTEEIRSMGDLNTLRARRGEKIQALKGLVYDANGSIKALTEPETALHASLKQEIEALGASIKRAEEVEALMASTALPVAGNVEPSALPRVVATEKEPSKIEQAGQFIAIWAKAKGSILEMRRIAAERFGERHPIVATLNKTTNSQVIPAPLADEIIELLRATSVVMSAGPRMIDLPNGKLDIPAGATGSAATYGAENTNIGATEPTFRQVNLTSRKLSAIVPMSNEILNDSVGNLGAWVRDDLVNAMAERMDLAFIRGDGTSNTPTGFLNLAQAGAKFNANATVNLANITLDLGKAELILLNNNIKSDARWVWIMAPRTLVFLSDLRDGNGNLAYPSLTAGERPMLRRKPVFTTTQIPVNLGGGTNQSEIYLVDMSHVMVGQTGGLELATSEEASFFDGSALQSAFSRDLTLVRAIHRHDIDIRQLFAVAVIQQVTWGF